MFWLKAFALSYLCTCDLVLHTLLRSDTLCVAVPSKSVISSGRPGPTLGPIRFHGPLSNWTSPNPSCTPTPIQATPKIHPQPTLHKRTLGVGWWVDAEWMVGGWGVDGGWMPGGWWVDGGWMVGATCSLITRDQAASETATGPVRQANQLNQPKPELQMPPRSICEISSPTLHPQTS